jgi:hypothetical protein
MPFACHVIKSHSGTKNRYELFRSTDRTQTMQFAYMAMAKRHFHESPTADPGLSSAVVGDWLHCYTCQFVSSLVTLRSIMTDVSFLILKFWSSNISENRRESINNDYVKTQ